MAEINRIEMTVNYRKNKNSKSEAYGKYYAECAKSISLGNKKKNQFSFCISLTYLYH